jgi:hypothetical protein
MAAANTSAFSAATPSSSATELTLIVRPMFSTRKCDTSVASSGIAWSPLRREVAGYACHCGHTFLKADLERSESKGRKGTTIRHPMVCVLLGHFVRYLTSRAGYDEFLCVNCGHPFCFARGT